MDATTEAIAAAVDAGCEVSVRQHTLPGVARALNVELAYGTEYPRPTIRRVLHAADLTHLRLPVLALTIAELHRELAQRVGGTRG